MTAQEITLNIAVNLGRLGRWADEGKTARIPAFISETQDYLIELENVKKNSRFEKTIQDFKSAFNELKSKSSYDEVWAEEALTWANILQHRAKLA
ncbi:MAG: hypothetical protein Q8P13_04985 [bacterium]|nr:hypothetical protein [bacterium]